MKEVTTKTMRLFAVDSLESFADGLLVHGGDNDEYVNLSEKQSGQVKAVEVVKKALDLVGSPLGCLAVFTDEVRWLSSDDMEKALNDERVGHLLEMRMYGADSEFHALRTTLVNGFSFRMRKDRQVSSAVCQSLEATGFTLDEDQYLDIDSNRSNGVIYQTTTGGTYTLPGEGLAMLQVRNYYDYDVSDGTAAFVDFRIVGLTKGGNE